MAKLFKIKRIDSIEDRKFNKYVLYILGEILLIVLGILIALEIARCLSVLCELKRAIRRFTLIQIKPAVKCRVAPCERHLEASDA